MTLENHGKLAIVEAILLLFLMGVCIHNNFRHGFSRETGWIYLSVFCLVRIIGSIMLIILETSSNPSKNLHITASIFNSIALGPLLAASLAFVNTCAKCIFPSSEAEQQPLLKRLLRLTHIVILAAVALGVVGGTDRSDSTKTGDMKQGATLLKVSTILFLVSWVVIAMACGVFFGRLGGGERKLLSATILALPFILIRIIYSFMNVLSLGSGKFSPLTGSFVASVFLGFLIELVVVSVYAVAGVIIYKGEREERKGAGGVGVQQMEMGSFMR